MRNTQKVATKEPAKDRTTVMLDRKLVADAKDALGGDSTTEVIERALTRAVQHKAMEELADLVSDPAYNIDPTPRRKPV